MSDVRLVLVDRLFLLLDGLQGPSSLNLYALGLSRPLEPEPLRAAVADLLAEQPLLRTRARRSALGLRREALPGQPVDEVLQLAGDEQAFMRAPLDLSRQPPVRILAHDGRLVMGIHHSVADGVGGYFVLDRLAAHYTARLAGSRADPPPPAPPRTYRSYFRRFNAAERREAVLGMGNVLREMLFDLGPYAVFGDAPLATHGQFSWRELVLPPALVPALREQARARGGTLNDLLLAATAEAGALVWPPEHPVLVMMPVSLREGGTVDMTNRVAELPIRLPAEACRDFEAAFAAVKVRTPLARDRARAFARICQYAIASRLPPALVRPIVARSLDRPTNQALTYVFSNTGVLDPQPRDFGPSQVVSVAGMPPLTYPPGLGVVAATARGTLTLTVAWVDPALAPASIVRFCGYLLQRLHTLAEADG